MYNTTYIPTVIVEGLLSIPAYNSYATTLCSDYAFYDSATTTFSANSARYFSNFVTSRSLSGNWQTTRTTLTALSSIWTSLSGASNVFLPITGGIIGPSVFGQLSSNSVSFFGFCNFTTTSSVSVNNIGTGPALVIVRNNEDNIALFQDLQANQIILRINTNAVSIGSLSSNQALSIGGNLSATSHIYSFGTILSSGNNLSDIFGLSADNVLGGIALRALSSAFLVTGTAPDALFYSPLSGAFETVYSTVQSNSSFWEAYHTVLDSRYIDYASTFSTVSSLSSTWGSILSALRYLSSGFVSQPGLNNTQQLPLSSVYVTNQLSVTGETILHNSTPVLTEEYAVDNGYGDSIYIEGNLCYITQYRNNMIYTYDITQGFIQLGFNEINVSATSSESLSSTGVYVKGRYAYTTSISSNYVSVYDITIPETPTLVSTVSTSNGPVSVFADNSYLYVPCYYDNRVNIFDINDAARPIFVGTGLGTFSAPLSGPYSVIVQNLYAYVLMYDVENIAIYNLINPLAPALVGQINFSAGGPREYPAGFFVEGEYMYTISRNLNVFNVRNPANPRLIGRVTICDNINEIVTSAQIKANKAYVLTRNITEPDTIGRLKVYDLFPQNIYQAEFGNLEASNADVIGDFSTNELVVLGGSIFRRGFLSTLHSSVCGNLNITGDLTTNKLMVSGSFNNARISNRGTNNLILGVNSGTGITTGKDNIIIGNNTANTLTTGIGNVIIGDYCNIPVNATGTIMIGGSAGFTTLQAADGTLQGIVPTPADVTNILYLGSNASSIKSIQWSNPKINFSNDLRSVHALKVYVNGRPYDILLIKLAETFLP